MIDFYIGNSGITAGREYFDKVSADEYATAFGFTEEEFFTSLKECGLENKKEKVKLSGVC